MKTLNASLDGMKRYDMVDFMRGLALMLMALDHAAFFTHTGVMAECYWESPFIMDSWPHWVLGLISNVSTPIFWFVSGIGIALYVINRRRKGATQASINQYFFVRAMILLLFDQLLLRVLWGHSFNVLSSLAVSILLISWLRFLPLWAVAAASLGLLFGYDLLWLAVPVSKSIPGNFWLAMWLSPAKFTRPEVVFPILGWIPLMGLGFVAGNLLSMPAMRQAKTWFLASGLCFAGWLFCQASGYGLTNSCVSSEYWFHSLIMSKSPPSLAYKLFNVGIVFFLFGIVMAHSSNLKAVPFDWVRVCGQAALFFYVLHVAIYRFLGPLSLAWLPLPGLVRGIIVWLGGVAVLVPVSMWYRKLKERHRGSALQYF